MGETEAPGKHMKSIASFPFHSKLIGDPQRTQLPNHAEPDCVSGNPFGLAHPWVASLVSCRLFPTPVAHLLQPLCHSSPAACTAEAVWEPLWELLLRQWVRTSLEVKIWLRIAPPYSYSLEKQLQQGLLWGVCEALRVWKCVAERASSYHQTQPASTES